MLTVLGAEAGHMGIRLLASGGVYLTGAFHCQLLDAPCKCQPSKTGGSSFSSWCCAGGITPKFLDRIQKTGELLETFLQPESRFHSLLKVRP